MKSKRKRLWPVICILPFPFLGCSVRPPSFHHTALRSGDEIGFSVSGNLIVPDLSFGVTDSSVEIFERTGTAEPRYEARDFGSLNLFLTKRNFLYGLGLPGLNPAFSLGYKFGNIATVVIHPTYSFYAREFAPGIQANFRVLPFFSVSYMMYRDELCFCYYSLAKGDSGQRYKSVDFHSISIYLEAGPFSETDFYFIHPSMDYETSSKQMKYSISLGATWGKALNSM